MSLQAERGVRAACVGQVMMKKFWNNLACGLLIKNGKRLGHCVSEQPGGKP